MLIFAVFAAPSGSGMATEEDGFHTLSLFMGEKSINDLKHGQKRRKEQHCSRRFPQLCDKPGIWHSQSGQDVAVSTILSSKRQGYFVDLAANHPFSKSNTRTLERDFGWDGLCIDGNEEFLMLLLKNRKCAVVGAIVSSRTNEEVMYRYWHGIGGAGSSGTWQHALSGIVGFSNKANLTEDARVAKQVGAVPNTGDAAADGDAQDGQKRASTAGFEDRKAVTIRFADLLRAQRAPAVIDYLSLDVEGAEDAVMEEFPYESYRFLVMSIESPSQTLHANLSASGYTQISTCDMPGETIYVHNSVPGGPKGAHARLRSLPQNTSCRPRQAAMSVLH